MTDQETRKRALAVRYGEWLVRWRWPVVLGMLLVMLGCASGVRFLSFDSDYRVFFSKDNPQLVAFDKVENIYTKNDNVMFVVAPEDGNVFTSRTLAAVEALTAEAWKIPFAIRVDSVTNFQYSYAEGDELIVEDLVAGASDASFEELERARRVALKEPLLVNRLVPEDARVTGVNVTLQLLGEAQDENLRVAAASRELAARIEKEHPGIDVRLTGVAMLSNAFTESGMRDMTTLVPLMYLVIFLVMGFLFRSASATFAAIIVITMSVMTGLGLAGWAGIRLTPPSSSSATMIMTLAVADCVHLLLTALGLMRHGMEKRKALVESLRVNLQPVFLTSFTTCIGFLCMNFSDVPPLRDLGNIVTVGIIAAFIYSVFFLPALMALLPTRLKKRITEHEERIDALGNFVVKHQKRLLGGSCLVVLGLVLCLPLNELNDEFVKYFDKSTVFRQDTDFAVENLTGIYLIEHSLGAAESGGISEPDYLKKLDAFAEWYRRQPLVVHVNSLTEIMKRLNRNMHGDDDRWYRLPETRDLAAQYLLLYEMSLPYGLDLNNQINVDKSATRLTVTLGDASAHYMRGLQAKAEAWLRENAPESMFAEGVGTPLMFSHISKRNSVAMLGGTFFAFILIAFILILALRSVKFGLLSLVPNLVPALMGFGVWGIFVGQINLGLSVVTGMTLGIVVDDTIHFLTKYLRARREQNLTATDAVRYAFHTVGTALWVTTTILVAGFSVLALSHFALNSGMGKLTAIIILLALVADFLLLPSLLIWVDSKKARS